MSRPRLHLAAWGIAACAFAAAAAAIMATRPMFVARATAEISRTEVSAEGLAAFSRVSITGTDRMLPTEIVARLRSRGTIRRALQAARLPSDEAAVDDAAGRIGVRLVAGTTVIETIVRANSREQAPALAGALFTAHETLRRERQTALTGALLAALDEAQAGLQKESQSVARQIEGLELQRPAGEGRYTTELDRAFVDLAAEKAHIRAALQRLEGLAASAPERLVQELEDASRTTGGESAFATQAGSLVLRASLAEKAGELARRRAQGGENSAPVQRTRAELAALHDALRAYLAGQVTQLRARLGALEAAGETIDARARARLESSRAIQVARVSPESEALLLRREAIRAELGKLERRRRELQVYKEVDEPSLAMLDAPRVSDAPEVALRGARLVLAGFGALLVGFSLAIILSRRALAVL